MKKENGFTLVELLIAMVVGAIVMAAAYSSFITQQKSYQMTESVSEIQQNLRAAMLFIERDLRMAGFNPRKENSFGFIGPLDANSFTITKDYGSPDDDGFVPPDSYDENGVLDPGETITYDINSNTLRRTISGTSVVIAYNITGMEIKYYNGDGTVAADPSGVRSVSVKLTAIEDDHIRELSSLVKCRNMGL